MKKFLLSSILILSFSFIFSQEKLKSFEEDYYDFLSLQGIIERPTLGYRTLSDSVWELPEDTEHIWSENNLGSKKVLWESEDQGDNWFTQGFYHGLKYKLYGPEWFNSYNTASPYGQNDGALWQGRGYNTSLTSGARIEGFGLEVTVKPMITWSENKDFEYLPGVYGSEFSYFWAGNIDLVQRYGNNPYFQFDFGDSEIRYNFRKFTVGFGTQSMWLGPAYLNPMLGSNNAGSYPKFDFGFKKTDILIPGLNWNIGEIEARIWIGQLTESDFFNNDDINDKNLINGFNISYSPSFWPDFTIGATKICLTRWGNNFWKYINPFYSSNDIYGIGEDQKCSVYLDFLLPKSNFEFYAEIGMDDYSSDLLSNFMHTWIYTVGVKKVFKEINSELIFEFNNFEMSQDFQLQWHYMGFYSHGQISEGYTQNGQLIGAGTSYFGNGQYLGFKHYYNKGFILGYIHRFTNDMNYIYNKALHVNASDIDQVKEKYYAKNKVSLVFGVENTFNIINNVFVTTGVNVGWIRNPLMELPKTDTCNFNFKLNLKYQL